MEAVKGLGKMLPKKTRLYIPDTEVERRLSQAEVNTWPAGDMKKFRGTFSRLANKYGGAGSMHVYTENSGGGGRRKAAGSAPAQKGNQWVLGHEASPEAYNFRTVEQVEFIEHLRRHHTTVQQYHTLKDCLQRNGSHVALLPGWIKFLNTCRRGHTDIFIDGHCTGATQPTNYSCSRCYGYLLLCGVCSQTRSSKTMWMLPSSGNWWT